MTMHSLCIVELCGTVSHIKIMSFAQQCFYGKFIFTGNNASYTYRFLKQIIYQIIALSLHFTCKRYFEIKECPFRRTVWLTVRNDI